MTIRTTSKIVTFNHPFLLCGLDDVQPAGSYEIENEATGRQLVFLQPGARQGALITLRADFNLHA